MHDVLLDQRLVAGLGNVYKSEVLFLSRLHPDTPASSLDDGRLRRLLEMARALLLANVAETSGPAIVTYRGLRRTTGRMNEGTAVGLQPQWAALSAMWRAHREPQGRRQCACDLLVSEVSDH